MPPDNMAVRIEGSAIAAAVRAETRDAVQKWVRAGHRAPSLAVIIVGDNPASVSYVRSKVSASASAGIESKTLNKPESTREEIILQLVNTLNRSDNWDGILVQLPLPGHMHAARVLGALNPNKDVDGLHVINAGRLATGAPRLIPCTPAAIMELLHRTGIRIAGRHAVIVGRSNLVGKPLAHLLLIANATVTVCHSKTKDLAAVCRTADILVAAVGVPHLVTADMVKPGATVIDVGINRVGDSSKPRGYRLVGDVDYHAVEAVAGAITPVPGGVGPMTVAMLLRNTLLAAQLQ